VHDTSLAIIPISGDRLKSFRKLRKTLRDVRDRAAHRNRRWAAVAMAGVADGNRALLLIKHVGLNRMVLWSEMERRWPLVVLADVDKIEPSTSLTVDEAVLLARRGRGIEPIRIVIPPQMMVAVRRQCWDDEPMPVVF
jgi:hypothetical protein